MFRTVESADRTPFSRRIHVLVLVLAGLTLGGAIRSHSGTWLPEAYRRAAHKQWQMLLDHWPGRSTARQGNPLTLEVTSVPPAQQFDWKDSASSTPDVVSKRFLKIEWRVEEWLIQRIASASLEIQDGAEKQLFTIEPTRLAHGSRTYLPTSPDIRLRLRVLPEYGEALIAAARFFAPQRSSNVSPQRTVVADEAGTLSPALRRKLPKNEVLEETTQSQRELRPEPPPPPREERDVTASARSAASKIQRVVLVQKGPALPQPAVPPEQ